MEIISENKNNAPATRKNGDAAGTRNAYLGTVLVIAGLLWLLFNLDILGREAFRYIFSWQTLLVVIGGYLLAVRKWTGGGIVTGIGLLFMATEWLDIDIPVGKVVLPAILIAVGIAVLLQRRV